MTFDPRSPLSLVLALFLSAAAFPQESGAGPITDPDGAPGPPARGDDAAPSLLEALTSGRSWLDTRYRAELAELRGTPKRGFASTLRGALGYETAAFEGFRGLVELESVVHLFGDPFNDGANGTANRALILDPDGTELNQGYLSYAGVEGLDVRLGRQEISLGNERFVGADPWRQNHQSFDALRLRHAFSEAVDLDYSLAVKVHRVFGRQSPVGAEGLRAHFLNLGADVADHGRINGYAILADFDDTQALSSNTLGLRYEAMHRAVLPGSFPGWFAERALDLGLNLEYAHQTDAHGNPIDLDATYTLVDASARAGAWQLHAGMERLGGSGAPGDKFSTPFASYQAFNGFADQFRTTPDAGLIDRTLGFAFSSDVGFLPMPATLSVSYHWFGADAGDVDYGRELDLDLMLPLTDRLTLGARYADFNRDEVLRNANRLAGWASYRLL